MNFYETSVILTLQPDGEDIYLVVHIKLPQFRNKRLLAPISHVFENNDRTKIKYLFQENPFGTGTAVEPAIISKTYKVKIGKCPSATTPSAGRSIGNCARITQGTKDCVYNRYDVTVEVTGNDGRKTTTYISEDADIDLVRAESEASLEENSAKA